MNYLLKFSLIVSLFLVACSDLEESNADEGVVAQNFGVSSSCLELVYPLSIVLPDGAEVEVDSKEDIKTAIAEYKEENTDVRVKPEIVFPIEVINSEGEQVTVESAEALKEMKQGCRDGRKGSRGTKCFELVYPITLVFADGSEITGETRAELRAAKKEFKEENPDVEGKPELQFPLQVIDVEGETIELNSIEELQALKEACQEG